MADIEELIERLLHKAKGASEISRSMAQSKSLRQEGHNPPRDDLYSWQTPEQTIEGRAATALSAQQREIAELREALKEAKKPRFNEPGYIPPPIPTHAFEPHPKLTGWCKHCGYPEGELLQHAALNTPSQEGEKR